MPTWDEMKKTYTQQKDAIFKRTSDKDIEALVGNMNAAISRYVNSAGISSNPTNDPNYTQAEKSFNRLASDEKEHTRLNQTVSQAVKNLTTSGDIQAKLQQVGQLREEITNLEKELQLAKQDLETSKTRQHEVEKPRQDISFYQGVSGWLGFTKPLQLRSIPFLVGFGLLLLFMSGLMMKEFFKPVAGGVWETGYGATEGVRTFFTDSRFYAVLAGIAFVGAVLGVLAYSGTLGKNVRA